MDAGFINLTPENLDGEHLCCIIRSKKAHPGVEAKRQWLADRLKEGHIFRKLNAKATVFIEYAPLETAWTPVLGDSYYYIYCLWVCGESKGKGGIAAAMHVDGTDVPWDEPKRYNLFMALYQTILRVMFNAPRFFAALPATNGKLTRPLVFYLILGMFQTLVERMWYLMSIQASGPSITDPKLQEVLGDVAQSMSLPLTILLTPGILAIQLCFFASVFYLMLRLVQPENVQFRTVFRVIAYSAAPTVVCVVPLVGPLVGSIWFGVCCFIGCKYSMRLPWSRTGLALGPLYLIAFAIGMQLIRQFLSMSA